MLVLKVNEFDVSIYHFLRSMPCDKTDNIYIVFIMS